MPRKFDSDAPYSALARFYDRRANLASKIRVARFLQNEIEAIGLSGRSVLDLACGTGNTAFALADAGFDVFGIDSSDAMLAAATRKNQGRNIGVTFRRAQLASPWPVPKEFVGITCLSFSLAYLTNEIQVRGVFEQARACLQPGGLFIFDMLRPDSVSAHFANRHFGAWSDVAIEQQLVSEAKDGRFAVEFAVRDAKTSRVLATETHQERAYEGFHLRQMLEESGLRVRRIWPSGCPWTAEGVCAIVAERPLVI